MDIQSNQPLKVHIDGEIFADFSTDVRQVSIEIQGAGRRHDTLAY